MKFAFQTDRQIKCLQFSTHFQVFINKFEQISSIKVNFNLLSAFDVEKTSLDFELAPLIRRHSQFNFTNSPNGMKTLKMRMRENFHWKIVKISFKIVSEFL